MGRIHRDEPQSSDDNGGPDSPSADDHRAAATSSALYPKKGRRSIQKKVVSVRIGDVEGSRGGGGGGGGGRGEAYPPSDSWAWRKYGQKPIKGSPYPRAYYRCSSSKGCGAKKQVERSRVDPTMLIITYASDHNHPVPATKHHRTSEAAAAAPATPSTPGSPTTSEPAAGGAHTDVDSDAAAAADSPEEFLSEDRKELLTCAAELGLGGMLIGGWLSDVANEAPSFVGPGLDGDDVSTSSLSVSMREEDESMFAELDELPECSIVFRRTRGISSHDVASLCGTTE